MENKLNFFAVILGSTLNKLESLQEEYFKKSGDSFQREEGVDYEVVAKEQKEFAKRLRYLIWEIIEFERHFDNFNAEETRKVYNEWLNK